MKQKNIVFVEIRSEMCAGTRGASLGIDAIKAVARQKKSNIFDRYNSVEIPHTNYILDNPIKYPFSEYLIPFYKVFENINNTVVELMKKSSIPVFLTADHANASGILTGIKNAHPNKRLGVIWIDAHADIHTPYTTPSGNIHGMPLAIALGLDNKANQIQHPSEAVQSVWKDLKNYGNNSPKIQPNDLVFIAVRDIEEQEAQKMEELQLKNITVEAFRKKRIEEHVENIQTYLKDCDIVYISFDVDSMDCDKVSYGTGTPVPNGLFLEESKMLISKLLEWDKVCGFEITEVNPLLDTKNKMAEAAFEILEEATIKLEENIKQKTI